MKMYCPRCGQEQVSSEVRFCSRCGFVMHGLAELVAGGGLQEHKPATPRRRGLKQGGGWFLFGVLFVPILGVLSSLINFPEEIVGLAALLFFLGGILRMLFALIFESGNPKEKTLEENVYQTAQKLLKKQPAPGTQNALPPQQSYPVDAYVAPPTRADWRDTSDLASPHSVTESTTKLLNKEEQ